jgi:histidyl-tRNA synthetase
MTNQTHKQRGDDSMANKARKTISTKALPGFMELLPEEQIQFNKIYETIKNTYEAFGFIPLDTPVLERTEVLLAKAGGETEKQIYKFKKGDTDLAMRFDLTVPLARYVVEHYSNLTFPFRRYAMTKVYRGEKPQSGRFREFYQCDIDVIGDNNLNLRFDAEIPSIINMIFQELGFKATIRVNNRKILNGLFEDLKLDENSSQVMQAIDQLEKIGTSGVKQKLEKINLPPESISSIFNFLSLSGSSDDVLNGLKCLEIKNEQFNKGVVELEEVIRLIRELGVPESNFVVDLTIARGLDYYTGTVYETQIDGHPDIGSVCSGGRYDDLASHYTDKRLPGVGISIGLTRLFDQLSKKGLLKLESVTPTQVLIVPMTADISYSLNLATKLRKAKIPTEVSLENSKPKKHLRYADKLGIPSVVFIGEDEVRGDFYTFKNLKTGFQEKLGEVELLEILKSNNKETKEFSNGLS